MAEYVNRNTVLRCIKESRENIDWGQSEDEDAFLHYSACLYRTIASVECLPDACVEKVVRCKDCINRTKSGMCIQWSRYEKIVNTSDYAFCSWGVKRNG